MAQYEPEKLWSIRFAPEFRRGLARLEAAKRVDLLLGGEFFEGQLEFGEAGLAKRGQSAAISLPVARELPCELTVNEMEHARIGGAGGIVARNDLLADRREQLRLGHGEEGMRRRRGATEAREVRGGTGAERPPTKPTAAIFTTVRRVTPRDEDESDGEELFTWHPMQY